MSYNNVTHISTTGKRMNTQLEFHHNRLLTWNQWLKIITYTRCNMFSHVDSQSTCQSLTLVSHLWDWHVVYSMTQCKEEIQITSWLTLFWDIVPLLIFKINKETPHFISQLLLETTRQLVKLFKQGHPNSSPSI